MEWRRFTWWDPPMADPVIPPSIRDIRTEALVSLSARLEALPLQIITGLYDPDATPVEALPHLARQFGVLDEGWFLADEPSRREIIRQALALQAKRGTPWALRGALAAIGFPGLTIQERTSHWASFKLVQPLGGRSINQAQLARIVAVVERWKPARCVLEAIEFGVAFESSVSNAAPRHDGTYVHDATIKYEGALLASVAYAKIGAGSPTVRIDAVTVQERADRLEVAFAVDAATANGLDLDTFAVFTASDTLVASATAPPVFKSASVTLSVTWTIRKV